MQRKISILATVFLAHLLIAFVPVPGVAWHHPPCYDDLQYERFGPRVDKVTMRVYGTQEAEYLAFKLKQIDLMDCPLLPSQKEELDTIDRNMEEYARASYSELGMYDIDINNQMVPTNDVYFRRALSHLIDKGYFITTELPEMAAKTDSPVESHGDPWYNHYCDDLYPYSVAAAAAILDADNDGNGEPDYIDRDGDGWRDLGDGTRITLIFYGRGDDPKRAALAIYLEEQLEVTLKTTTGAGIDVNLLLAPPMICYQRVWIERNFHLYTGGWRYGKDPSDALLPYLSTVDYNYVGYDNPNYDNAVEKMLEASEVGDAETVSTAVYHCHDAQKILMDDAAIIPVWYTLGLKAYLSCWEGMVNEVGRGIDSWWTFLNAHPAGQECGGTFRWGFMNDVLALNIIHSQWYSDWNILDKIYDVLLRDNPYKLYEEFGWMAELWVIGEWVGPSGRSTKLTFYLREDMVWQDLPYKVDRVMPDGYYLPDDVSPYVTERDLRVTAYDVEFTVNYIRSIADAWNHWSVAKVDHVTVVDEYAVEVYYDVYAPLWALHWVGDLPIMPRYVWQHIPADIAREYDPISEETLVGSGPYKFDYDAMEPHEYYELDANTRYFNYHSVRVGIQTSTAADTPQIYVMNHKVGPQTVDIKVTLGAESETITGVTVLGASHGKPGVTAVTSSLLAGKSAGIYGPITVEIVGGHSHMKGTVTLNTLLGDVDGDFVVTLSDCTKFSVFYGWNPLPFGRLFLNGDVNGDCKYDILDAILLQLHL